MATLHFHDTGLTVRLSGARRVFGRWRPLEISWDEVVGVRVDAQAARAFPGARWGVATNLPGVINLGSFRRDGRLDFWDVAQPDRAIVVELQGGKYDRLILEVEDPRAAAAEISARLARRR
jgi:hypothetical protein